MLKIRTIILSVVLAIFLILTVQMVTAESDFAPETETVSTDRTANQETTISSNNPYGISEYRSNFGECLDVSISELAACQAETQSSVREPLDECFDVSLMEVASCRSADESSAP